ncbi:MAG: AAA family ATPase [Mycobacterium sp.]
MTTPTTATTTDPAVAIHETHTGIVILIGDRAFKIKKPILTDFLDFRTVESRQRVCAREVALNSRLAPDSYLGVAQLDCPGKDSPEPVVVIRRYPDRYRLRSMIERGEPTEQHLTSLAGLLADFHSRAERSPDVDRCATVSMIEQRWQANLAELQHHSSAVVTAAQVEEISRLATRYIAGRSALFTTRITEGRIVDGHGDLMADDIFCCPEGPVPLDCLEFDDRLRYVDGIDDAAFLAMDLEFLGRPDLADQFLDAYRAAAGDRTAPRSLAHFYIAYRAVVRAKVDCIRFGQGQPGADRDAKRHLDIALNHLQVATVRMILVGGGPGTGKTTLATKLAESIDAEIISMDSVRRELQSCGAITGSVGTLNTGLYSHENVAQVYETALERAGRALQNGRPVILDGTWRDASQRRNARALAGRASAVIVELVCCTDLSQAEDRIQTRGPGPSDATPQIARDITEHPWHGAVTIDTGRPLAESIAEALQICCSAI